MRTFQVSPLGQIANAAKSVADLNHLGRVSQAQGFALGQVVVVTLGNGAETIWVNALAFESFRHSPAMIRLTGVNPKPVTDLNRALAMGCNYIRLRQPAGGGIQMDEEEETVQT